MFVSQLASFGCRRSANRLLRLDSSALETQGCGALTRLMSHVGHALTV